MIKWQGCFEKITPLMQVKTHKNLNWKIKHPQNNIRKASICQDLEVLLMQYTLQYYFLNTLISLDLFEKDNSFNKQ